MDSYHHSEERPMLQYPTSIPDFAPSTQTEEQDREELRHQIQVLLATDSSEEELIEHKSNLLFFNVMGRISTRNTLPHVKFIGSQLWTLIRSSRQIGTSIKVWVASLQKMLKCDDMDAVYRALVCYDTQLKHTRYSLDLGSKRVILQRITEIIAGLLHPETTWNSRTGKVVTLVMKLLLRLSELGAECITDQLLDLIMKKIFDPETEAVIQDMHFVTLMRISSFKTLDAILKRTQNFPDTLIVTKLRAVFDNLLPLMKHLTSKARQIRFNMPKLIEVSASLLFGLAKKFSDPENSQCYLAKATRVFETLIESVIIQLRSLSN